MNSRWLLATSLGLWLLATAPIPVNAASHKKKGPAKSASKASAKESPAPAATPGSADASPAAASPAASSAAASPAASDAAPASTAGSPSPAAASPVAAASPAGAVSAAPGASPAASASPDSGPEVEVGKETFELVIGTSTYHVELGRTTTLTIPGLGAVPVTLKPKEIQRFSSDGIAFNYPSSMKVSRHKEEDVITFTVEGTESAMVTLNLLPKGDKPEEIVEPMLSDIAKDFSGSGAKAASKSTKTVHRKIAGADRTGRSQQFQLAGRTITVEVYAYQGKDRLVAVALQNDAEEAAQAARAFDVIVSSLE